MTKNEAIGLLDKMKESYEEKDNEALNIAIAALEEVQQYHAIGSVEAITEVVKFLSPFGDDTIIGDMDTLYKYKRIGTVEECREAMKKQTVKKPILYSHKKDEIKEGDYIYVKCSSCGEDIFSCFHYPPWNDSQKSHKFCKNCGQAIDLSERM